MKLLDELHEEHELIDRVAGSLLAWSSDPESGSGELDGFLRFLREYVRGYHHEREEQVLFAALVEHAEVAADRGPLPVLVAEHLRLEGLISAVEATDDEARAGAVRTLVHHVWEHVDKERSVLLPEARKRLERAGMRALEGREPSAAEASARGAGETLVARYPPVDDPDVVRGDGCICCAAFASACHGIEAEWWTDHEWRHHRGLDEG